jgi:hypothetical protein
MGVVLENELVQLKKIVSKRKPIVFHSGYSLSLLGKPCT